MMNSTLQDNDEDLQKLLTEMLSLSSFAEVQDWGSRAAVEIGQIRDLIRELDTEIVHDTQLLEKLTYERSRKIMGTWLGRSKEEKELSHRIEERKTSKSSLSKAANQLQEILDFTPRSFEEKESLLLELRKRKRRLQEEKREITQVARGPRLNRPPEPDSDIPPDPAALERRKARYEREARLKPGETTLAALTRQIDQAQRDIEWVEKFNL